MKGLIRGFVRAKPLFYLIFLTMFYVPTVSMASEENERVTSSSDQPSVAPTLVRDNHDNEAQAGVWWYLLFPTFILILVGFISWFWLRSRGGLLHGPGPLKLVQVLALGQRNRLFVVQYEGVEILFAETPNHISLLHTKSLGADQSLNDKNNTQP